MHAEGGALSRIRMTQQPGQSWPWLLPGGIDSGVALPFEPCPLVYAVFISVLWVQEL
jgi:hypothetical protein